MHPDDIISVTRHEAASQMSQLTYLAGVDVSAAGLLTGGGATYCSSSRTCKHGDQTQTSRYLGVSTYLHIYISEGPDITHLATTPCGEL